MTLLDAFAKFGGLILNSSVACLRFAAAVVRTTVHANSLSFSSDQGGTQAAREGALTL